MDDSNMSEISIEDDYKVYDFEYPMEGFNVDNTEAELPSWYKNEVKRRDSEQPRESPHIFGHRTEGGKFICGDQGSKLQKEYGEQETKVVLAPHEEEPKGLLGHKEQERKKMLQHSDSTSWGQLQDVDLENILLSTHNTKLRHNVLNLYYWIEMSKGRGSFGCHSDNHGKK